MGLTHRATTTVTLVVLLTACCARIQAPSGTLQVKSNRYLYFDTGSGRILIKALEEQQQFQGMALVDRSTVFVAYTSAEAEASTHVAWYDLLTRQEHEIAKLFSTASSQFRYNKANDLVAFNWDTGIYVFSFAEARRMSRLPSRRLLFERSLTRVVACSRCFEPEWAGPETVKYVQYGADGREFSRVVMVPTKRD